MPVNKITEVYVGQPAMVQLDAFDTNLIPHMPGKVTYVSAADRLEQPSYGGSNMPLLSFAMWKLTRRRSRKTISIFPRACPPQYYHHHGKTVIYYIFEPLIRNWDRALRE